MPLRVTFRPAVWRERREVAAHKNFAIWLDNDYANHPLAFGSKPSSADCPCTAALSTRKSNGIAAILINS
jgi:hypothetical protein